MASDKELAKILKHCDNTPEHLFTLEQSVQIELKQYCQELIKYGGTAHHLPGGKIFTDNTLLKPAKNLVKFLKRKKEEEKATESGAES